MGFPNQASVGGSGDFTTMASGHLVSGRGFWGTRGYQLFLFFLR